MSIDARIGAALPARLAMIVYGSRCAWWDSIDKCSSLPSGLPCCPHCRCPLFQIEERHWLEGARQYEAAGHSGYVALLNWSRGKCFPSFQAAQTALEREQSESDLRAATKVVVDAMASERRYTERQLRDAVAAAVRRVVVNGVKREKAIAAAALGAAQGVAEPPGSVDAISSIQPADITRRFTPVDEQLYVDEAVREAAAR